MKYKGLTATMVLLVVAIAFSVWGDPTSLSISNADVAVTSPSSTTLSFPISRTGDTSYDAFVQYETQDGSAVAGIDYTSAIGSLVIPAGATSASIPVTVTGSSASHPDKTFQMLLLGGGGAARSFMPSFATQQTFATGGIPVSVTAADVNGDGRPDLIVANRNDNTVSVLLNTTAPGAITPSFASQQTFGTGNRPISVATADINGDGKPDLIVANQQDDTVSVLLNTTAPGDTTPTFATQQTFATGSTPVSVTVADVNGDGHPDLIVANEVSSTVSVLLNTTAPGATTPSFATQQTFSAGHPNSVTVADLNGDGKPDLIAADIIDNTVSVLLNTTATGATTASFAAQQAFGTGTGPVSVTAADLNGDGRSDLIVANSSNTVSVLLNTTAPGASIPSFATQQTFATASQPFGMTAIDLNGDGKPDLIVTSQNGNKVSVLLNTTAPGAALPAFTTQQIFATGSDPVSVTAADLNGDGKPDLIVANEADSTVSALLNTTPAPATTFDANSFATQQPFGTGSHPISVTTADVNGDGKPDLIVANFNTVENLVSVLLNNTSPGASTPSFAAHQTFTANAPFFVTAADLNGDGRPDLIVLNGNGSTVSVLLNTTAPGATIAGFAPQQAFNTGTSPFSVMAADVNGDGKPDLIVANFSDNTVSVLLNTTSPGAATPSFAAHQDFATGTTPRSVTVADVNGDGKPDLIAANFNDDTVSVLLNTTAPGATTPSFAAQQTFATGIAPFSVTAADVDGDGKPDLIVANLNDKTASVLLNTTATGSTTSSFAAQQTFNTGTTPESVTAADVNGDGKPDLIVANNGNNTVSVLLNALYATIVSGSPATGTIHYSVATPTPTATATATATPTTTATATPTATATATATATSTATATPTPVPVRLKIKPNALKFPTTRLGTTSKPKMVKVSNPKGNMQHPGFPVLIEMISDPGVFMQTNDCPASLAAGASCSISVTFTPSAAAKQTGTLTITDNAIGGTQTVSLSGTGK